MSILNLLFISRIDSRFEVNDKNNHCYIFHSAYQERSSREIEIERRKTPFKDVEAQKIREDVTIQVKCYLFHQDFNLLYVKE